MEYKLPTFENGIKVGSLEQYLGIISNLNHKKSENSTLFFRGQEADCWKIEPSIFRDNLLSVEHTLMQEPLRQIPQEFIGLRDDFEVMTKYQHYGMCTRLLDLTTNPLVALSFACAEHAEERYIDAEQVEIAKQPCGVVYFKEEQSILVPSNMRVKLISALAKYDMNGGMLIKELFHRLLDDSIISTENEKRWSTEEGIEEFIKMVQNSYLISPVLSNERLIRQSGIFMLPGRFNFSISERDIANGIIEKSECDLKDEFEREYIYILPENKSKIRRELDACNINEANLFPELEHQLWYIRQVNTLKVRMVNYFEKFQGFTNAEKAIVKDIDEKQIDQAMQSIIYDSFSDEELAESVFNIIKNLMVVDWYKRESALSRMRKSILTEILKFGINEKEGRILSKNLVARLQSIWMDKETE